MDIILLWCWLIYSSDYIPKLGVQSNTRKYSSHLEIPNGNAWLVRTAMAIIHTVKVTGYWYGFNSICSQRLMNIFTTVSPIALISSTCVHTL